MNQAWWIEFKLHAGFCIHKYKYAYSGETLINTNPWLNLAINISTLKRAIGQNGIMRMFISAWNGDLL